VSQKANPTLVGAFVLGGIVLVVVALAMFGGGRFFTEKVTYVAFFDEPLSGLSVGARVNFRGVKVGEVRDIQVIVGEDLSVRIPVYLRLQRGRIREAGGDVLPEDDLIEKLIARGLRAQLEVASLVTGQIQIQLDFAPDQPPEYTDTKLGIPEMPTIRSSLAQIRETIESLSIDELLANAQLLLSGLNDLVHSPDLKGSLHGLNQGIKDLQSLITAAKDQIDPLSNRFKGTLDEADVTLRSMQDTLAVAREVLDTAEDSLGVVGEESTLRYELERALDEVTSAARSVRVLADYLERNPDALLRGKAEE